MGNFCEYLIDISPIAISIGNIQRKKGQLLFGLGLASPSNRVVTKGQPEVNKTATRYTQQAHLKEIYKSWKKKDQKIKKNCEKNLNYFNFNYLCW